MNQILVMRNMDSPTVGISSLQFDPDKYQHANLKAVYKNYIKTEQNMKVQLQEKKRYQVER